MQTARNLKAYKKEVRGALDNTFLRETLDKFAVAYRSGRAKAFGDIDIKALVDEIAEAKDQAIGQLDALYATFKANAEKTGITVHLADTAEEANRIIAGIAKQTASRRIVKSKSMTAEETLLNHHLEAEGLEVTETDLGEWIIQLRHEGPSHMVMPAIHLSRYQVADLFTDVTGKAQDSEIERLVKVARRELRHKYVEADMGITGANFAIAETRHHRADHQRGQCAAGDHPAAGARGPDRPGQAHADLTRRPSDQPGPAAQRHRPDHHLVCDLDHGRQRLRLRPAGPQGDAHRFPGQRPAGPGPGSGIFARCCAACAAGPAPMSARSTAWWGATSTGISTSGPSG